MQSARRLAAFLAAITVFTPLSFSSSDFLSSSIVSAEGASLPDWIPHDFDSAAEFRNQFGATHIEDGLVCVVSCFRQNPVPEGEPQGVLRYDIQVNDPSVQTVRHTNFSSQHSSYYYDIAVFDPKNPGDFEVAVIDTWAKDTDPDLKYGHAVARYSFSAKDETDIIETDIFSWLPDGKEEFNAYLSRNGEVSVKDNYVIFCTMTIDQFGDRWEPDSHNQYEHIEYLLTSDCTMQAPDLYDDGSVDKIYVYQAIKDGHEKISWTRTSDRRPDPDEPEVYTLTADCAVVSHAQTILLPGQMRATLADYDTGETITLSENQNPSIWTDISFGTGDDAVSTGPILVMETNPAIVDDNLGGFIGSNGFSFGLDEYNLPDGYAFLTEDRRPGYYGGTIIPENHITVNVLDNGAADVVFRLKFSPTGDVNDDGLFNIADAVLLQKWLLAVPDVSLVNWMAADFRHDNKLNTADFTLMKQRLLQENQQGFVKPDERSYGAEFYVVSPDLKLYFGPDESYHVSASVPYATILSELGYQKGNNKWVFTEYAGKYGWIKLFEDDGTRTVDFFAEVDKPVIYLYPEQETDVHIELELTEAELSTTYPKYQDGWDVTAYPDGTLLNKADGTHHRYLFWDAKNCSTSYDFSQCFCVAGSDTERFLKETLTLMGLTEAEMNEFIVYWLPRMEHHAYNLIAFQGDAYTNSAKLTVTPEPDSECRVFMAYIPLENAVEIEPQQLESFERNGFALVEWGGTEITSNIR